MIVNPSEAAASLEEIESIEQRTRERLFYERSSATLILWGVLVAGAYLFSYFEPQLANAGWIAITIAGLTGSRVIHRRLGNRAPQTGRLGLLLFYSQLALLFYGGVMMVLLWPMSSRQIGAFWSTLWMLGFVFAGLFLGRFYIYCGLLATAVTVAGYFWAGVFFPLWMAAMYGCVLIAAGLWLRRAG
jgi:hypothetical protein